jgi:tol-pal system protein YbgF
MMNSIYRSLVPAVAALCLVPGPGVALAQDKPSMTAASPSGANDRVQSFKDDVSGLFEGLIGRSEKPPLDARQKTPATTLAQASDADLVVRLERMEGHLRQLTGTIEQLQYRNQQLEQQVRRMQEDAEFRFQELGSKGSRPAQQSRSASVQPVSPPQAPQPVAPGRRADAFDPAQNPAAPGAPRALGSPNYGPIIADEPPVGIPGGRQVGAPLDLSTLAGAAANDPSRMPAGNQPPSIGGGALPPPPQRNTNAMGGQVAAVQPPAQSPKDEYDLGYGYILRKDFALAEDTFRSFLHKYPNDRLVSEVNYWLGESMFQRQRYRDAAEAFLTVSTKFDSSAKAPEALLRLGQSLAALGEREAACAALNEVGRKYPRASSNVKQGVQAAQKRARC